MQKGRKYSSESQQIIGSKLQNVKNDELIDEFFQNQKCNRNESYYTILFGKPEKKIEMFITDPDQSSFYRFTLECTEIEWDGFYQVNAKLTIGDFCKVLKEKTHKKTKCLYPPESEEQVIDQKDEHMLKEGDFIVVNVKRNNHKLAEAFKKQKKIRSFIRFHFQIHPPHEIINLFVVNGDVSEIQLSEDLLVDIEREKQKHIINICLWMNYCEVVPDQLAKELSKMSLIQEETKMEIKEELIKINQNLKAANSKVVTFNWYFFLFVIKFFLNFGFNRKYGGQEVKLKGSWNWDQEILMIKK